MKRKLCDVYDIFKDEYVVERTGVAEVAERLSIPKENVFAYISKKYKVKGRYLIVHSGVDVFLLIPEVPRYKVFDTQSNSYIMEDVIQNHIVKELQITASTIDYAVSHENPVMGRYLIMITEDVIQEDQWSEWDNFCKKLRGGI